MTPGRERISGEWRSRIGGWPLAVAISTVLAFLFFIRHILLPFLLAAALAFLLTPIIDGAHRRWRGPRWLYATATFLVVLAILGGLAFLLGNMLTHEVPTILRQLPQLLHKFISQLARITGASSRGAINPNRLTNDIVRHIHAFFKSGEMLTFLSYGIAALFGAVLSVVVLAYFLVSGKQVAAGAFWLVPPEYRSEVRRVLDKVLPVLWRYFVGLLVVVTYTSLLAYLVFGQLFHVPHAALLAIVVGFAELVPIFGPAVSLTLEGLAASQQTGVLGMIGLFGFAIALRLSIDELVSPLVLGRSARIHPVVVIFAFLSGAVLFGIIGLLLAVPVAATIKIILTIYYAEPVDERRDHVKERRTHN
ncbi:MAG: AI-2E family transporter [Stellaceae bacterium]